MSDEAILLFKTYDKNNSVIRSGRVFDSIDSIAYLDTEILVNFTDSDGNLIDSINLSPVKNDELYENPICFLAQDYNGISCRINAFYDGCKRIVYYKTKDPKNSTIVDIVFPNLIISGIETEEYKFVFYDSANSEKASIITNFYAANKTDDLSMIENYIKQTDDYTKSLLVKLNSYLQKNNMSNMTDSILSLYDVKETSDHKVLWFNIMLSWIKIYNERLGVFNNNISSSITIENSCLVKINPINVDKIKIEKNSGEIVNIKEISLDEAVFFNLNQNNSYKIFGIKNNYIVAVIYVYMPANEVSSTMWGKMVSQDNSEKDSDITTLSADYINFSDQEKELAVIQNKKDPYFPLLSQPTVEDDISDNCIKITIDPNDYNLIKNMGESIYVVVQETDNVIAPVVERKVPISAATLYINKAQHYLSNLNQYFVWIQDSNQNILSDLYLFDFNSDDLYSDYSRKIHQIYFKNYINNLIYMFNDNDEDDLEYIKKDAEYYLADETISESNFHVQLIKDIKDSVKVYNLQKSIELVYRTMLSMGTRMDSFFDVPVYYKSNIDTITFAPKVDSYILDILKFNISGDIQREFIISSNGAIDYKVEQDQYDYYLFHCIDIKTLYTSGFIMICNIKQNKTIRSWNLNMEVINDGSDA